MDQVILTCTSQGGQPVTTSCIRGLRVSKAITVCLWARTLSQKVATPFSYASAANDNEFLIHSPTALILFVGGQHR